MGAAIKIQARLLHQFLIGCADAAALHCTAGIVCQSTFRGPWHSLCCHFSRTVFYFHVRDFRHSRRGLLRSNCRRVTTKVKLIDANMMRFISRLSIPFPFPLRVISRRPNKLRFAGPRDHHKREGHHANRKKHQQRSDCSVIIVRRSHCDGSSVWN